MANPGSQTNIYDEKGTVLYRAVPYHSSYNNNNNNNNINNEESLAAAMDLANSAASISSSPARWKPSKSVGKITTNTNTGILGKSTGFAASTTNAGKVDNYLGATSTNNNNNATSASNNNNNNNNNNNEAMKLMQTGLTPESALAMLFPPEPLEQQPQVQQLQIQDKTQQQTREKSLTQIQEKSQIQIQIQDKTSHECKETGGDPNSQLLWMRVAAVDHTGRLDVLQLREHLEHRCETEHARPSGVVCTIRESIFTDGLREMIRQITILCPERGILLAELAAEMQQTTNTYDILFDSACQYAVRKAIERDMRRHLFEEKEKMQSEVRRLENRVNELRAKHDGMQKRFEEQKQTEIHMHEEEVKYLKKANLQIINEIKRITALEKATAAAQASAQKTA